MISLQRFYSDEWMFLRYYLVSLLITLFADVLLLIYGNWATPLNFSWWYLLLLIGGIAFGILSAAFIHNATHRSFRPLWLNRIIGEMCGVHQLYGFLGWAIAHIIHHKYPDNPLYDPHAPGSQNFWPFTKGMQKSLRECLGRIYYEKHGETDRNKLLWKIKNIAGALGMVFRLLFWFLLLGPNVFIWFYIPSLVTNILFFAHFNYYTHRISNENVAVILDLNHSFYYKMVNFLFFGIYYHKSHHLNPSLFNPQKARGKAREKAALQDET